MDNLIIVNNSKSLSKTYVPTSLVTTNSRYKEGILLKDYVLDFFMKMKQDALKYGYNIDIMSGYRSYEYQKKIYNNLINEKGFNYAFRKIAKPGCSEHQTALAIDFCVYKDNNCYIESELEGTMEAKWVHDNCYKYGFILRYPEGKEDITGFDYEPWHIRFVGDKAEYIYKNNLTLEEYVNGNLR